MRYSIFVGLVVFTLQVGCKPVEFTEDQALGGEIISGETLTYGYEQYMLNCYACHGENGDGKGPAAQYLRPPPRDFRSALFKFGGVGAGDLPHTKDLVRLVKRGLTGTAMLPWDIPDSDMEAIIHYIKTFSEGTPID